MTQPSMIMWSPGVTLEQIEEQVVRACYSHFKGNKTATASALGIAVRTLDAKLEKYKEDEASVAEATAIRHAQKAHQLARSRGIPQGIDYGTVDPRLMPPKPTGSASELAPGTREAAFTRAESKAGVHVEPIANAAAEQPVPVSEREKVQDMPPKRAAGGGARGAR